MKDGVEEIRTTLNKELLKLNEELTKSDCNFDFTLGRIGEISKVLKKLPKKQVPELNGPHVEKEEKKKSIFDQEADSKR